MRRRRFIVLAAFGASAWSTATGAQPAARVPHVGVLMSLGEDDRQGQRYIATLRRALDELGWRDGDTVRLTVAWGKADSARIATLARELVEERPAVILAQSALAAAPVQQATRTIPIVFVQIIDPAGSGLVPDLKRPPGNVTGFADPEFSVAGKMLELLKEAKPLTTHVAVLHNPAQSPQVAMLGTIEAMARALGVKVSAPAPRDAAAIERAIEALAREPGSGAIVLANPITNRYHETIVEWLARILGPAVYSYPYLVVEGGLMSYGIDPAGQFRQAALYIDRLLKGARPAELPVQLPTRLELAINLRVAKALGLELPATLLARADEVIE